MEVLGNEALGKIVKLVDETKFLLDLECKTFSGKRAKQTGRVLNVLSAGELGEGPLLEFLRVSFSWTKIWSQILIWRGSRDHIPDHWSRN